MFELFLFLKLIHDEGIHVDGIVIIPGLARRLLFARWHAGALGLRLSVILLKPPMIRLIFCSFLYMNRIDGWIHQWLLLTIGTKREALTLARRLAAFTLLTLLTVDILHFLIPSSLLPLPLFLDDLERILFRLDLFLFLKLIHYDIVQHLQVIIIIFRLWFLYYWIFYFNSIHFINWLRFSLILLKQLIINTICYIDFFLNCGTNFLVIYFWVLCLFNLL